VLNLSVGNYPYPVWLYSTGKKDILLILMILIPGINRLRRFINDLFQKLLFFTHRFFVRAKKKYGAHKVTWDHKHKRERIIPYEYESANRLLEDFWLAVDQVMKKIERG